MCGFVILLLLLSKNGSNNSHNCPCGCNPGWNPGDYARGNGCGREADYGCMEEKCWKDNGKCDCDRDDYRRDCGCNACEEKSACESSPVTGREDIWTSYKNPSSGSQNK